MKILVDLNLSREWLEVLERAGWKASHRSHIGSPTAPDTDLLLWARQHGWVLLTQDLDFAELLFHTQAGTPSVVLLRLRNELDSAQHSRVCTLLHGQGGGAAAAERLRADGLKLWLVPP